jgi:hypothetical protein
MKITQDLDNNSPTYCKITVKMSKDEKKMIFLLIQRHIQLMPQTYRKRHFNRSIVSDMTCNGSGYSAAICEYLGIDPDGYKWEKQK